jgi:hypothetical protein
LEQKPDTKPSKEVVAPKEIITEGVTPLQDVGNGYVQFNNALFQSNALRELRPDLFSAKADLGAQSSTGFGSQFPKMAMKGDIFVRVDVLPNRVFKFDGNKWLEQNKSTSQSYLYNKEYIEFLIERINSGEYDLDVLSDDEKSEIEAYLKGNQNS